MTAGTRPEFTEAAMQQLHDLVADHDWPQVAARTAAFLGDPACISGASVAFLSWLTEYAEQSVLDPAVTAPAADRLRGAAKRRQIFRERHRARLSRRSYVSLGCECQPWVILNRWGFRDTMRDMNPFSLGVHRMPGLLGILESRFDGYAGPGAIGTRPHAASRQPMLVDPVRGITWNHHRGPAWTDDDFARFRAHQAALVPAFYEASRRPGAIHVMSRWAKFHPEGSRAEIDRLLAAISEAGAAEPRLVILDFGDSPLAPGITRLAEGVHAISRPYPTADYVWSNIHAYRTPEGMDWELGLMRDLIAVAEG
ncbi:DUF1796 family putative cysteine peptidase [Poseidonocella sp. HB161398]|uniref:DUF1796 family putative cysteine peptidase n=1 Tax=Poseidonocella sp. HB161398 TaxID=2320855 RepID=UPI0011085DAC|nr:DUF1796 family putative cysteine peptidase [Poseidonocella sp. HB161398]